MNDEELERMQRELYDAVTQQNEAHAIQRKTTRQADQERVLLDNQIKSGIQTQMYKDSQAIANISDKVDLQGQRINALSHNVTSMTDSVNKAMEDIRKTATLDTLYSEREKALSKYYEQMREEKEEDYRRRCDEIDKNAEARNRRVEERYNEMLQEMADKLTAAQTKCDGQIQYAKTEYEEYNKKIEKIKKSWKKWTFAVCFSFVLAVVVGIVVGLLIAKNVF